MPTTALDTLILAALGYAAWVGWRRGLVIEVLSTVGLLLAIVCGFMFHDVLAGLFTRWYGSQSKAAGWVVTFLAFVLTFMIVFRLWMVLARLTAKAFRMSMLGIGDRIAGAFLGLTKASLAIAALVWVAGWLHLRGLQSQIGTSVYADDVLRLGRWEYQALATSTPLFLKYYHQAAPALPDLGSGGK